MMSRAQKNVLDKGMLMNELGETVFQLREEEGFKSETWVDLVRNYRDYTQEEIVQRAGEVTANCAQQPARTAPPAANADRAAGVTPTPASNTDANAVKKGRPVKGRQGRKKRS